MELIDELYSYGIVFSVQCVMTWNIMFQVMTVNENRYAEEATFTKPSLDFINYQNKRDLHHKHKAVRGPDHPIHRKH